MNFEEIKTEIGLAESQLSSFKEKGTKVSCTRTRAHLLSIKKLCDKMRRDVLNAHKSQAKLKKDQKNAALHNSKEDAAPCVDEAEMKICRAATIPDDDKMIVAPLPIEIAEGLAELQELSKEELNIITEFAKHIDKNTIEFMLGEVVEPKIERSLTRDIEIALNSLSITDSSDEEPNKNVIDKTNNKTRKSSKPRKPRKTRKPKAPKPPKKAKKVTRKSSKAK